MSQAVQQSTKAEEYGGVSLPSIQHPGRREVLKAAVFSSLTLPFAHGAIAQEHQGGQRRSTYTAPRYQRLITDEEILARPAGSLERWTDDPRELNHSCAKVFISQSGYIQVESLESLYDRGWIIQNSEFCKRAKPSLGYPSSSDPDIRPTTGSCTLLKLKRGEQSFFALLTNDHITYAAKQEIECRSVSDWCSDVNLIPLSLTHRGPFAPSDDVVPVSHLPGEELTNATLEGKDVELVGIGAELFRISGKAISIPVQVVHSDGRRERRQQFFGLRVPPGQLRAVAEIGGMSGSPILIKGTRNVVGVLAQAHEILAADGTIHNLLMFAGPNELRQLASEKVEELYQEHASFVAKR